MQSNSFEVGSYYFIENTSDSFFLGRFIRRAFDDGVISEEKLNSNVFVTAKCVRRTAKTVTFFVPLLGIEVKVWTKRYPIECENNEIARIKQMGTENGLYKGRTCYPELYIMAYDDMGNNENLNTKWKMKLDAEYAGWWSR